MAIHLMSVGVKPIRACVVQLGAIVTAFVSLLHPCVGQVTEVGGIARNFTVTDRRTGQPIRMTNFAGKILVMDFFAYWCGPCQTSTPDLKANVDDYYQLAGGNAHGVPVVVMSVNIESENPPATDAFITGFQLNLVADDFSGVAYNQFGNGFIPMFVIINGVAGVPAYDQWEVLYRNSGYPGAVSIRTIVDSVDPTVLTGPAFVRVGPASQTARTGALVAFNAEVNGQRPITYQWYKNDVPKGGNTNRMVVIPAGTKDRGSYKVTVSNALGSHTSASATLMVYAPGVANSFASVDVPKAIPDYPQIGAVSIINIQDDWEVIQLGVNANISHTWIGDLQVSLTSPSGATVILRQATGGSGSSLVISQSDVRAFLGQRARGTWTLRVKDLYAQDVGTLNSWSLNIQHPPAAMSYQEWAAGYPGINLTDPAGDLDGDTIPNFVEFLLNGFSPQTVDRIPSLEVDPGNNEYFQWTVSLRPNVERAVLSVQLAPTLDNNAWTEAVTSGDNVIVDQSVPDTVKVRFKRSLGTMFFRLKGVQL